MVLNSLYYGNVQEILVERESLHSSRVIWSIHHFAYSVNIETFVVIKTFSIVLLTIYSYRFVVISVIIVLSDIYVVYYI